MNEICQNDKINLKFYFHEEISRMKYLKDAKSDKNIHKQTEKNTKMDEEVSKNFKKI